MLDGLGDLDFDVLHNIRFFAYTMKPSSTTSWFAPIGALSRPDRSLRRRKRISAGDSDMYKKHVEDYGDYRRDLCSASMVEEEMVNRPNKGESSAELTKSRRMYWAGDLTANSTSAIVIVIE